MPNGFPCPNPICSHVFPADGVKGTAALKCPRCGNVFQFGHQPAKPARPAPPPPPPPPPRPVPVAAPVAAPADLNFDEPVPPRLGRKKPRRGGGFLGYLVGYTFLAAFLGAVIYFVVVVVPPYMQGDGPRGKVQANYSFRTSSAWKNDDKRRRMLDANSAVSRSDPRAHVAIAFHDYKTRQPSDDELVEEAVKRLKGHFPRLEYVDPVAAGKGKAGELGGEPALVLVFKATAADEVPMVGECLMLTRRGYGYWFFTWGPAEDEEALPDLWAKQREGFRFASEREGWQPSPRPTTPAAVDGLDVQLSFAHEVWRKEESPADYDPLAVLAFRAFEAEKGRARVDEYAGKAATVQVLVLPKAADLEAAGKAAEGAITKQMERLALTAKLEPYVDSSGKLAAVPEVGAFKGEMRQLSLKVGTDAPGRFAVLAVVSRPAGVLAIYGECPADRRGYWLGEFKALLESVRPAK